MLNKAKRNIAIFLCTAIILGVPIYNVTESYADANIILDADFETNQTIGETPDVSGISCELGDSSVDSITVQQEDNGNKAIKLVVGNAASSKTRVQINIPNLTSGKYTYSFEFKAENHSRYIYHVGTVQTSDARGIFSLMGDGSNIKCQVNYPVGDVGTSYIKVRAEIDANNKSFDVYYNDTDTPKYSGTYNNDGRSPGRILFLIQNDTSKNGPESGDGVYWIDNIKIERHSLKVNSFSPVETENVSIDSEVAFNFNTEVATENLTADYFTIKENGTPLDASAYTVTSADNKTVKLNITEGLKYGRTYVATARAGIAAQSSAYAAMGSDAVKTFKTKSIIPTVANVTDDGHYTGSITPVFTLEPGIGCVYTLSKDGGTPEIYTEGTAISDVGIYRLHMTASDANGKSEEKEIGFEIVARVAPFAENVSITGDAETGATLTGSYTFTDYNNDAEGTSTYRWLSSSTANGAYTEIATGTCTSATGATYTLLQTDENKYIKFEVTPVSVETPYTGQPVESAAFTGAFAPTAKDAKITYTDTVLDIGSVIKAEYEFMDINGDTKETPVIKWYRKAENAQDFAEVSGATGENYTLSEADKNSYIKFSVTPVSNKAPANGDAVYSDEISPFLVPIAKNVSISGDARVGDVLAAFYEFYDPNGDSEGNTRFRWYVDSVFSHEGKSFTLSSDHKGSSITLGVIPVSSRYPYEGAEIISSAVYVNSNVSNSSSSFGGGSFGGGSSKPVTSVTPTPETPSVNNEPGEFNDTKNHWASAEIKALCKKGIVNGVSADSFEPDASVTRAQFATMISKLVNVSTEEKTDFADVPSDTWYYNSIQNIAALGLMNGDGQNFDPDRNITREEVCMVLNNIIKYLELEVESAERAQFADESQVSDWAKESVNVVSSLGLIKGMEDGTFSPKSNATRAQAVVIINRLIKAMGE